MMRERHKRKKNHVVLVTSDGADPGIKQFRINSRTLWSFVSLLCVVLVVLVGYIVYEERIWAAVDARSDVQVSQIATLQEANEALKAEKLNLESEIAKLNEATQILSDTVNQNTKTIKEMQEQIDRQSMPTEFPLSASAAIEEAVDGGLCVFTATAGTVVRATASGTVTEVAEDEEYGHSIYIDHGNGYVTIYRNGSEPLVAIGDQVKVGDTLFEIEDKHEKLGYQMMKDGSYIDPMELLAISG